MKAIWKTIPSFPDYEASSLGEIRRSVPDSCGRLPRNLKPVTKSNGRFQVSVCRDRKVYTREISQLVAEAFLGPRPAGMFACHKNDVATENAVSNLYYGTPKQNSADAVRNGKAPRGAANGNSTLTETQALFIKRFHGTSTEAAKIVGVGVSTACRIRNGQSWSHL